MKKHSILIIVVTITMAVLAVGCKPPFSAAPVDRARDTPFSVEVRWQAGGAASSRGIIDDSLVTAVAVEVLSSGGNIIGSGSLHKGAEDWHGTIQVSQIGLATFLASAKDSGGVELYYGEQRQTLSGVNDQVTIAVARQVRGIATTFAGTPNGADGIGSAAVFNSPQGIATDGTNLYVADTNNYTIRKIVISTGEVTTVAGMAGQYGSTDGIGSAARFYYPGGITTDGANLYVADGGNKTIRKIVLSTGEVTTLAGTAGQSGSTDGMGSAARFWSPSGITTDDGTNLYIADSIDNTIRKIVIANAEVTTLAGTTGSPGSADGMGSIARFSGPRGITIDGINLYVTDSSNHTIRKIVISTADVTTLAGTVGQSGSTDGAGSAASFNNPSGITTDGSNLYVADTYNFTIRKVVISSGEVTTMAGMAGQYGYTDGFGNAARFYEPIGITIDGTSLYLADSFNATIRKIVISSGEVTTLAGTPNGTDGTGSIARFWNPNGITADGANLYVADSNNSTIRKIVISTGEVTTLAGTAGEFDWIDGIGSAARFCLPYGITTDGANLYLTDVLNVIIRKIVITTGEVTTLAGSGDFGSTDGTGSAASFNNPYGITTDGSNLYVADSSNHTIRKIIISTAEVTTFAGTAGQSGSTDGIGSAARFNHPRDITTDGTNLYVTANNTIRKIVISTAEVTTLAGAAGSSGSTDGTGSAARFYTPSGIAIDGGTSLYVADSSNHTIRKVVISTGAVTTLTGTAGQRGNTNGTGSAARFNLPRGITFAGTNLFVSDSMNNTIRKIE